MMKYSDIPQSLLITPLCGEILTGSLLAPRAEEIRLAISAVLGPFSSTRLSGKGPMRIRQPTICPLGPKTGALTALIPG
jgi:hypothetical protein